MDDGGYDFSDFSDALDDDRGSRTSVLWTAAILSVGFFLWVAVSISGLAPWLGSLDETYRDGRVQTTTADDGDIFGGFFGLSSFVFLSGQEVYVDYDITLRRGAVQIIVREHAGPGRTFRYLVAASGSGTFAVPISRTDLYHISIRPSATGGVGPGYDFDVSASWGARWP